MLENVVPPVDVSLKIEPLSHCVCCIIRSKLEECDFTSVLATSGPNEAYDEFMKLYCDAFEVSFPLRGVKKKRQYIKREPCVTPALLVSSRKNAKLYVKKMRNPTDHNKTLFREYNNLFNRLKGICRENYYKSVLEENKYNIKKT